jgi:signal transduction histidine kinase
MSSRDRRGAAVTIGGGLLVSAALAGLVGASAHDTLALLAFAVVGAAIASLAGAVALRGFRGRPVRAQVLVIVLSSLLVASTGVLVAAKAMFISSHDFKTLLIVLVVSASVSVGAALQLGADIDAGARHVGDMARGLVDGATPERAPASTPSELASLSLQLAEVSRQLSESWDRERASERSRRELISWVSHDLRSPLAAIRAMAEALDDHVVDERDAVERYHYQMRHDAERLSVLVEDLFELARIHSGVRVLDDSRACLQDVVADALAGAQARARGKGVAVVDEVGPLPPVDVPEHEWARVLHNLLDNAIRHTPSGGRVVVESQVGPDGAVLAVIDECGGIPDDDLDRVFDVAFRGDAARSRDGRGGGLGLAIAKGLVEAQAGSIDVANHGGGCRFTVRLPLPA